MIEVIFNKGRLGNRLFMYCFGRIVAEGLGYVLRCPNINGFPKAVNLPGYRFDNPIEEYSSDYDLIDPHTIINNKQNRRIRLNSFFQNWAFYKPHLESVKKWLWQPEINKWLWPRPDDIVVHVRLGDYVKHGYVPNPDYYKTAIESMSWKRCLIITDEPKHQYLANFTKYNPIIANADEQLAFQIIKHARKIVISPSTFSWWAAILSNADEIVQPVSDQGVWGLKHHHVKLEVDLPTWRSRKAIILPRF